MFIKRNCCILIYIYMYRYRYIDINICIDTYKYMLIHISGILFLLFINFIKKINSLVKKEILYQTIVSIWSS